MKANEIINLSNKSFTKKEVTVYCQDVAYTVVIDNQFRETVIMELIDEFMKRSDYCAKHNLKFDIMQNMYILMIKHFTDIKFNTYKSTEKQYSHDLDVVKSLIDLGLFKQIIEAFDPKEVEKIGVVLERCKTNVKVIANRIMAQELEQESEA